MKVVVVSRVVVSRVGLLRTRRTRCQRRSRCTFYGVIYVVVCGAGYVVALSLFGGAKGDVGVGTNHGAIL